MRNTSKVVNCPVCNTTFEVQAYRFKKRLHPCCSPKCASINMRRPVEERFWEKVDTRGSCWIWKASRLGDYGQFRHGREVLAHRVAFLLTRGPIPKGQLVCHNCDNPLCCNPDHLWLGDHTANLQDMARKGRSTKGQNPVPYTRRARGEHHAKAVLTDKAVKAIRLYYKLGQRAKVLMHTYHISKTTFYNVIHRRTWNHIR